MKLNKVDNVKNEETEVNSVKANVVEKNFAKAELDTGELDVKIQSKVKKPIKMSKDSVKKENKYVESSGYGYSDETIDGEPDTPWAAYLRGDIKKLADMGSSDEDDKYMKSESGVIDSHVDELVRYFTSENPQLLNQMERDVITKEEFLQSVIDKIKEMRLTKEMSKAVFKNFKRYMWSYDRLDPLIDDEDISDIKCLAYNCIRVKRLGHRETSDIRFKDKASYARFVERAAIKNRVSISDQNAVTNFTDKTSNNRFIMRWNISTPFVNSIDSPYVHIRKIDKHKVGLKTLIERKMMDEDIARFLRYEAAHSEGMIFTGKGASGKTTCMNALLDLIPLDKSGLVIQENEELFSDIHPDLMFQKTVLNKGEGRIQYSLQDLARNGLLLDLDVFVIGEIKGAEALYMLNASYTGHTCWASVHGASSTEGINKLVDYIKYASDYSREDALHMLTHLETVVFMKNYKIWEVSKIVGWDDAKQDLIYKPIIRENKLVVRIGEHGEVLD
jgi:pilus assembly protein CpaF